mmetsp:Transcript_22268/g.71767  ORF Transcript_22268/g.71767 Transcript_22268/m.71767 type:complete len:178 (-) Transcript_22268:163-696(-)
MFSDSEHSDSQDEEDALPEAKPEEKTTTKKRRYVDPWLGDAELSRPRSPSTTTTTSKRPRQFCEKEASSLAKIKASYVAPPPRTHASEPSQAPSQKASSRGASKAAASHWSRAKIADARHRAAELQSNPAAVDGRAAYERRSLHGSTMVISVGPSSLPKACRTTMGRIPDKNAKLSM